MVRHIGSSIVCDASYHRDLFTQVECVHRTDVELLDRASQILYLAHMNTQVQIVVDEDCYP